jgi:hypothetical protein
MTIEADGDAGTIETKGWPWTRRPQGFQWVLMSLMVLTKTPRLQASHGIPVTVGAVAFVGGQ